MRRLRSPDAGIHPVETRRGGDRAPRSSARPRRSGRSSSPIAPATCPQDRRAIEAGLRSGDVRGVASTNALELGVDIVGLDAVVIDGFPGTRSSFWQQAGRAGRREADALVVLVAGRHPLDRFLFDHPEALLDRPVEATVLHPSNPHVLGPQLLAAAAGAAAARGGRRVLRTDDLTGCWSTWPDAGALRRRPNGWYVTAAGSAARQIDLRAAGARIDLVEEETGRIVGVVDAGTADLCAHDGAVYVHRGDTYLCEAGRRRRAGGVRPPGPAGLSDLSAAGNRHPDPCGAAAAAGRCGPCRARTGRGAQSGDRVPPARPGDRHGLGPDTAGPSGAGRAHHRSLVDAGHRARARGDRAGPTRRRRARGGTRLADTCCRRSHRATRGTSAGASALAHPDTGLLTVIVHDSTPGGAGFAERGFAVAERWLAAAAESVTSCDCPNGCPGCVVSAACSTTGRALDKPTAGLLLDLIAGRVRVPGE